MDFIARYTPFVEDAQDIVDAGSPSRVLTLGTRVPDANGAGESRLITEPEVRLPRGIYEFMAEHTLFVMSVDDGDEPAQAESVTDEDLVEGAALDVAWQWFDYLWPQADSVPEPKFPIGADVQIGNGEREGTVRQRRYRGHHWTYMIQVAGEAPTSLREDRLSTAINDDDPRGWVTRTPEVASAFSATLTRKKLDAALSETVYSFRATRTMFRPYQFKPVLKMLETGNRRLLIADEVGLGKTIEAGLVWTELEARRSADRVLVVAPSSLVPKWKREMEERFGFDLHELKTADLDELLRRLEEDRLPARKAYIASIEGLRVWDGLERATTLGLTFDLVLVDEAHALRNVGTKSNDMGQVLSDWAEAMIFLSATPLNLGTKDLFGLLDLLVPGQFLSERDLNVQLLPNIALQSIGSSLTSGRVSNRERRELMKDIPKTAHGRALARRPAFEALTTLFAADRHLTPEDVATAKRQLAELHSLSAVLTRTRKVDVQEKKPVRRPHTIAANLTAVEQEFYDAFRVWCVERAEEANMPLQFAMQMPLRLASSSLQVAKNHVLSGTNVGMDDEDAPQRQTLVPPSLPPSSELVSLAHQLADTDSKFDQMVPYIRQLVAEGRRVLLFTFSRQVIAYLEARLAEDFRVASLHGGVKPADRHSIMSDFREGAYDVVVANRVASEGLDFEFCSAVINYDLPWNPMEIEQRIGRIDRIGQTEPSVQVAYFHVPGTIEGDIVVRVMERIEVFKASIGALEPILDDTNVQSTITDAMLRFDLSPEERAQRASEATVALAEQRLSVREVEASTSSLLSVDTSSVEGLEDDLVRTGRYLGQVELAHVLKEWAAQADGECRVDGAVITLTGSPEMAKHLRKVAQNGFRGQAEISELVHQLNSELPIALSLDQEGARQGSLPLLTANHALVLGARQAPRHRQARFGAVSLAATRGLERGSYLVLLSEVRWSGIRSFSAIWPAAVDLQSGRAAQGGVADALWSRLAEGELHDLARVQPASEVLRRAVISAVEAIEERRADEEDLLSEENEALVEARVASIDLEHKSRVAMITERIEGLVQERRSERVISLNKAQIHAADRRRRSLVSDAEQSRNAGLELSHFAACLVEVH